MNKEETGQKKLKSPAGSQRQRFPTQVCLYQLFWWLFIFSRRKNQDENFLEKSSYTELYIPKELNFFSKCPCFKRTTWGTK